MFWHNVVVVVLSEASTRSLQAAPPRDTTRGVLLGDVLRSVNGAPLIRDAVESGGGLQSPAAGEAELGDDAREA